MAVVLPSGGSFLGSILLLQSNSLFWLDDFIMMPLALLTDVVLTLSVSLAIVVGVAVKNQSPFIPRYAGICRLSTKEKKMIRYKPYVHGKQVESILEGHAKT
jgi:hypothetical protein